MSAPVPGKRPAMGSVLFLSLIFASAAICVALIISYFTAPRDVVEILVVAFFFLLILRLLLQISEKLIGWPTAAPAPPRESDQ